MRIKTQKDTHMRAHRLDNIFPNIWYNFGQSGIKRPGWQLACLGDSSMHHLLFLPLPLKIKTVPFILVETNAHNLMQWSPAHWIIYCRKNFWDTPEYMYMYF